MKKNILIFLFCAFIINSYSCKKDAGQVLQKSIPEVGVSIIKSDSVTLTSILPGRIAPLRIAEVRPQVSGIIKKRYFKEGSEVKAGEILYQIDSATYEATLANAKASLAKAEASLPSIRQKVERYKELLPMNGISKQDYEDALALLKQVEAEILYWQAAVKNAEINLGYTRITAPISGRIGKSNVTEGALVTANQVLPLTTIQQIDPVYIDVTQSTSELLRLKKSLEAGFLKKDPKVENKVTLILEDGRKYPLSGTLQFKDITVDPSTGSVSLRVLFPNPNNILLPGMFVRAEVFEGINKNAILIPQESVMRDPKGNPFVFVVKENDEIEQRPIIIDRAIGNKWLLQSGIKSGERIVIEGIQKIKHGDKVKVVNG